MLEDDHTYSIVDDMEEEMYAVSMHHDADAYSPIGLSQEQVMVTSGPQARSAAYIEATSAK